MIKYLENKEIIESRKLYEEVFNDSLKFTDYYFNEHSKTNRILGCYEENRLISMMHLKPNHFLIKGSRAVLYYIYAVATEKSFRRKGFMEVMMNKALLDLYNEEIPLCYLIPENEKTYLKFEFSIVCKSSERLANTAQMEYDVDNFLIREIQERDFDGLKDFIKERIYDSSDFFIERSSEYFLDMIKRLKSEDGNIELLIKGKTIKGYAYVSDEEKLVLSEIICDENVEKLFLNLIADKYNSKSIEIISPTIMIRILRPELMAKYISAKENLCFTIKINDSIIVENNKIYEFNINNTGSKIEIVNKKPDFEMNISEFTEWIFDYKKNIDMPNIDKIKGIHINEIL